MSDHFIGMSRGAVGYNEGQIFYATSTTAKDVEVRIADAALWTRDELRIALSIIADKIGIHENSPDVDAKYPPL